MRQLLYFYHFNTMLTRVKQFQQTIAPHKTLFWAGLILKLVLGSLLASGYLLNLFAPFVNYSVSHDLTGSYTYFNEQGISRAFPYPPVMQWLLSIPRFLIGLAAPASVSHIGFADIISVRLVLLLADVIILYVLLRWFTRHARRVLWLYWLSPILIYINYVHGQLDVIPIALLLLSLQYLFKNKWFHAMLLLALAVGCKTSILLAVPFIIVHAWRNSHISRNTLLAGVGIFLLALVAINAFYIGNPHFRQMVYNNAEQVKLFFTSLPVTDTLRFLVVPAVYFFLLIRFSGYWTINRNLLLMFMGFAFGIITIFIAPMQGWYYWCLPFFIYFRIKEHRYTRLPFWCINLFYFLYFLVIPASDYQSVFRLLYPDVREGVVHEWILKNNLNADLYTNIISTLLQTSVIAFCWVIYRYGISQMQHYKILYQPYLVGIAGDSATGKTTLAALVEQLFGKSDTTIVNGDDMHRWERGHEQWKQYTHLDPRANLLHQNLLHTLRLKKGQDVNRRHYNHDSGTFSAEQPVRFKRVIVFEGLHSFYLNYQQQLYDLCVFLKPSEVLRTEWKLNRDTKERGHSTDDVLLSIERRQPDADAYIHQQEQAAHLVLGYYKTAGAIGLRIKCLNHIYLDDLVDGLTQVPGFGVKHFYEDQHQYIECEGIVTAAQVEALAADAAAELEEMGFVTPQWQAGYDGVLQLVLLQTIFYQMRLHAATHGEGSQY
jgi:uridine kinase